MHGDPNKGTGGVDPVGVHSLTIMLVAYKNGKTDERKAVRQKVTKMLGQVKRLEIYQDSAVTLRELIVWLDERKAKVAERAALKATEALQAECIKQKAKFAVETHGKR